LSRATAGITPKALYDLLANEKWLLMATQARELLVAAQTGMKELKHVPEKSNHPDQPNNLKGVYEISVFCRVFDQWSLESIGYQGYYVNERGNEWYKVVNRIDEFRPWNVGPNGPNHSPLLW